MYNKILVTLDGSQVSEHILPYARSLAKALKIPVELLHAIDPDTLMPTVIAQQGHYNEIMTAEKKRSADYLSKIAGSFSGAPSVDCSLEIGRAAETIVDRAAADAGTLIAMTTHGRSGVKRWLLGSVAEKVLHAATNHMLLARATGESKKIETASLKRIVAPLDGSKLAELALPHAAELARTLGLEIVLVRAVSLPAPVYSAEEYTPNLEELWDQIKKEAQEYLDEKLRQLKAQGLEKVSAVAVEGFAADKIIDVARQKPESLIAMSTHGRSGVGRWVLGSVTERVVRHSDDPVLIVRATSA
jgi:nucleotide-binding universal stress UspA family protein